MHFFINNMILYNRITDRLNSQYSNIYNILLKITIIIFNNCKKISHKQLMCSKNRFLLILKK